MEVGEKMIVGCAEEWDESLAGIRTSLLRVNEIEIFEGIYEEF